jgi:uncharacterized protein HemX
MKKILILAVLIMAGGTVAFGQQKASSVTIEQRVENSIKNIQTSIESVNPDLKLTAMQERQLKNYYQNKYMSSRLDKAPKTEGRLTKVIKQPTMKLEDILTPAQREALKMSKTKVKKKPKE